MDGLLFPSMSEQSELKLLGPHNQRLFASNNVESAFERAFRSTIRSRYFYAMLVYFVTSMALFANDFVGGVNEKNKVYFTFAVIHTINAVQFAWSWDEKGYFDFEMFPEYINIIEGMLYVFSSSLYGRLYASDDAFAAYTEDFYVCRRLEMIASVLEVAASIGWVIVWYRMYVEKVSTSLTAIPGRGLSIFDPDFHANWSLVLAAAMYVVYNVNVSRQPSDYEVDRLYLFADGVYAFNSICYMLSTLRDYGWGYVLLGYDSIDAEYHAVAMEEKIPLSPTGGVEYLNSSEKTELHPGLTMRVVSTDENEKAIRPS